MPIAPENRKLYPPRKEWAGIRTRILDRAAHACECRGECNVVAHNGDRCGAPNGLLVERTHAQTPGFIELESWHEHEHDNDCLGERCKGVRVVLTIAHLDHDPRNNAESNLRALCQRCHLRYDAEHHRRNAAKTRARKRDEKTGQRGLL